MSHLRGVQPIKLEYITLELSPSSHSVDVGHPFTVSVSAYVCAATARVKSYLHLSVVALQDVISDRISTAQCWCLLCVDVCAVLCRLYWCLEPCVSEYTAVVENAAGIGWFTVFCRSHGS